MEYSGPSAGVAMLFGFATPRTATWYAVWPRRSCQAALRLVCDLEMYCSRVILRATRSSSVSVCAIGHSQ
eukprot:688705-Prymnesium_polylepis.4